MLESLGGARVQASLCEIVGLHRINVHAIPRCGAELVLGLLLLVDDLCSDGRSGALDPLHLLMVLPCVSNMLALEPG